MKAFALALTLVLVQGCENEKASSKNISKTEIECPASQLLFIEVRKDTTRVYCALGADSGSGFDTGTASGTGRRILGQCVGEGGVKTAFQAVGIADPDAGVRVP